MMNRMEPEFERLRTAVETVLATLRQHGFTPFVIDYGDGWELLTQNPADAALEADECWMRFQHAIHESGWIRFIPEIGCPEDCMNDHSCPKDGHFTAACDAAMAAIEEV